MIKGFVLGGAAATIMALTLGGTVLGQDWRRQSPMERFMAETPQAFIFSCNFTTKKSAVLRKIEVKISSRFYLSDIIPANSIDMNDEDLTQLSAESLCAETWAARIKSDTLDYFKILRRDLSNQVAARSRLLQQISATEKQALYVEEEKRIERIKQQIRNVDRIVTQIQVP